MNRRIAPRMFLTTCLAFVFSVALAPLQAEASSCSFASVAGNWAQPIIIIARLLSSEPWSLERFQVYSVVWSRHGYLINPSSFEGWDSTALAH